MKKKRKGEEDMNLVAQPRKEQTKKDKIQASFAKAIKKNGKALEKLSKN